MPQRDQQPYRRILTDLRTRIAAGDPAPGQPFEAATVLAERYGTSTAPVHKAFGLLAQEGLVDVRPGSGVYVLPYPQPGTGDPDLARVLGAISELRAHLDARLDRLDAAVEELRRRDTAG